MKQLVQARAGPWLYRALLTHVANGASGFRKWRSQPMSTINVSEQSAVDVSDALPRDERQGIDPLTADRGQIARDVYDLARRPPVGLGSSARTR